jgi:two-component system chemotaxis sensor kinase CheA
MAISHEVLQLFMTESETDIGMIEHALTVFESDPQREEVLQDAFRGAHTLNGAAGAVDADNIRALAHCVEDVFDLVCRHRVSMDTELVGLLTSAVGVLRQMCESFRDGVDEPSVAGGDVMERLLGVISRA